MQEDWGLIVPFLRLRARMAEQAYKWRRAVRMLKDGRVWEQEVTCGQPVWLHVYDLTDSFQLPVLNSALRRAGRVCICTIRQYTVFVFEYK